MPEEFDEITNHCRTQQGIVWQDIRERLIEYDKACPKGKREKSERQITGLQSQVKSLLGEVHGLRAAVNSSTGSGAVPDGHLEAVDANYAGGATFQGKCNFCKKWGHRARDADGKPVCKKLVFHEKQGKGAGADNRTRKPFDKFKKDGKGKGKGKKGKGKGKRGY